MQPLPVYKKHDVYSMQHMGKQFGLVAIEKLGIELSSHQVLALSVHMRSSKNAIQHLQKSVKVFLPNFNILLSNVCN